VDADDADDTDLRRSERWDESVSESEWDHIGVVYDLLHAMTHALGSMLVPLYLLMRDDLRRRGVGEIALIVTAYGVVYALLSYPAGMLADRMNRKVLLGVGLIGNACAVALMGLTHSVWPDFGAGSVGGMFGSVFHPAANALVPAHFPKNPGMPIGIMGIGSGLGFFVGPRIAGWRAEAVGWQRPCLEMGIGWRVVVADFIFDIGEGGAWGAR
jgi:MFS family permease